MHTYTYVRFHPAKDTFDSKLEYFRSYTNQKKDENVKSALSSAITAYDVKPLDKNNDVSAIKNNSEELKKYLQQIYLLESNIYATSTRLKELYRLHEDSRNAALASQFISLKAPKEALENLKFQYNEISNETPEQNVSKDAFKPIFPAEPEPPQKPQPPELKQAGLFNKKKVMQENQILTDSYNSALHIYEQEYSLYLQKMQAHQDTVRKLIQEQEDKYFAKVEAVKAEHSQKVNDLKAKLDQSQKEIAELDATSHSIATPEKAKNAWIEAEIARCDELLRDSYKTLNELYSYNVIFAKYRDFVSVSTFYEYLCSGRCASLEGVNGAYNLYENEIRLNAIINKLDIVIESLDQIKANQFTIYSAIQQTNQQLSSLNIKMSKAVSELSNMHSTIKESAKDMTTYIKDMTTYMEQIEKNTAVSAYNSEVTAFYSKKTAELTNAMGYLIALA